MRLLVLLLSLVTVTAEIIPSSRRVTWQGNVGVPGGIPHYTTVSTSVFPSDDLTGATDWANIQTALHNAADQTVVDLANGQFYINDLVDYAGQAGGVVIRGRGPKQTKIILTAFPARIYMRRFSFDEAALSIQTDLAVDAVKGTSTITPTNMPSWIVVNGLIGIDQVDDEINGVTDFGQEGNSTYRKVLGHEFHTIDNFDSDVSNWSVGANATTSWFSDTPPEAGQTVPGTMKFTGNFTNSTSIQSASVTYTLPASINAALDYTRIYFSYRIDAGSSMTTSNDYADLQFVLKNGAGLTAKNCETVHLENRANLGWLPRNIGTFAFTNSASDVRAITMTLTGTNYTGPVSIYIDAIRLIGGRGQMNVIKVSSVTSSNFTTALPLFADFKTNHHAQLFQVGHNPATTQHLKNCGIEDLTIESAYDDTGIDHIIQEVAENCWIKNVHCINSPGRSLLSFSVFCYRGEIRDSFADGSHEYGAGQAYGIALYHGCVGYLIENNILRHYHAGLSVNYGCAGNVFGYNYGFDPQATSTQTPFISAHGTHTFENLFEGNWGETKVLGDVTHGSSGDNTVFRNRLQGYNYGRIFDQVAISLEMWNRKWNIVGNVLGVPNLHTNYSIGPDASYTLNVLNNCDQEIKSIFELGYFFDYGCSSLYGFDSPATLDLLNHGNWDAAHSSITWDGSIADHALPTSYYLSAKPSWWDDGAPFPPVDPTTTTTGNINAITIPAKLRYERDWVPPVYTKIRALGNPVGGQL